MNSIYKTTRSTAHGSNGACATSHPLATLAALEILKVGGNAADAAVAASAVLCVVEPMMTGIGGDCFVLYAPKGGPDVYGLNGSGRAPKALAAGHLRDRGWAEVDPLSVHAVTVPGAVDAWARFLTDHGRLGLERALEPAIRIALDGFVVTPVVARAWEAMAPVLEASPAARRHWLVDGRAPAVGEYFKAPGLARALRLIAHQGRRAFYDGQLTDECLSTLKAAGGLHTAEDFATTRATRVEPIATDYRGQKVMEIPPNGQGLTTLVLLNILENFDLSSLGALGAERLHLEVEAQRIAFGLRDRYVAEGTAKAVVQKLLDKGTARELARQISPHKAMKHPANAAFGMSDTIYLSVVDRDLNACSFINSLYMPFGSGIVTPETGIIFQNRGACFVLDEGHPNCLEGGKRPMHTIIPALVANGAGGRLAGKVRLAYGVMGGHFQPMGQAHVLSNIVDFAMDIQGALDAPRLFWSEGILACEPGIPADTIASLEARGHRVETADRPLGGGQIVAIDWAQGTLAAASDPRKDGCALAY